MGRPEADNDHQDAQPREAFHQTPEDHQSQQHPISYPSPSTHNSMTYIVGRPICRADSNDDQEPAEHNETPNPSSDSNRMHEHEENQTHQEVQPGHNHHHHVHYHLPTTNPHSTNLMTLHNCPNNNAHQHQSQAMPPGLRPHPPPFYPPPSHPPHHSHYSGSQHVRHHSQPYSNYSGPQHVRQNSQLSNYSGPHHVRHHSQPFSNYSGSQHVQQVVLHPPPAAYNYPSYNNNFATGIPTNIEYMPVLMPQSGGDGTTWKTGLFDCLLDPSTALLTMFCPCWTFGQIAEIVDNGQTACSGNAVIYMVICCFIVVPCLLSCTYRRKMRNKFDLPESPGPDCIIHFLCEYCALCQEHRELQLRGLDPSLGWVGNMEQMHRLQQKQRQATTIVPPVTQRMGY